VTFYKLRAERKQGVGTVRQNFLDKIAKYDPLLVAAECLYDEGKQRRQTDDLSLFENS